MADARKPRRRSRRDLDAVADGASDETPLGAFVSEMRAMGARDGVEPNQTLTEFVSAPSREPDLVVASTTPPKARTPMIAQLSALAATTVGKVALTGGIAAAAVGGAVVVNEIQDPDPVEVVATADDSTSTSTTATPTSTTIPGDGNAGGESASAGSSTHAVLDAGSVTVAVDGLSVRVVSADPNPGWTAEIETDEPGEAQVNFRSGDARVDFRAEIEDGQLRIRIRDRRTDTETETFPNSDNPAPTPDDDDDDDRSGSNSGSDSDSDDDDDRSGSNWGSDSDDDDDDDRSGSNSGSDSDDDDDEDRSGSNSGSG